MIEMRDSTDAAGFCFLACAVMALAAVLFLSACSVIGTRSPPPDWPELAVKTHAIPHASMRGVCAQYLPWYLMPESCAVIRFDLRECHIYLSADFPGSASVKVHEEEHCRGIDHLGGTTLADMWRRYKEASK